MEYKKLKLYPHAVEVMVRADGQDIIYNERSLRQSLVKSKKHKRGFYQVSIAGKRIYVHHLVAMVFVTNERPVSYKIVLHKDGNTLNNHFSNLEWGDRKKAAKNWHNIHTSSENNGISTLRGASKISHEDALKIARRLEKGEFAKDICKEYGVSEMSIARIRKRYCQKPASVRYSAEVKKMAAKLLEKHEPADLVSVTGINYHTLYRWKKKLVDSKTE